MGKIKDWKKEGLKYYYHGKYGGNRWLRIDFSEKFGWSVYLHLDSYNQGQIGKYFRTKKEAVEYAVDYMTTTNYIR